MTPKQRAALDVVLAMGGSVVWEASIAPPELLDLSTNGGDEDWVTVTTAGGWVDRHQWSTTWLSRTDSDEPARYEHDGMAVYIGSHA